MWKTLRDLLVEKEYSFRPSPEDTFRVAQQSGFIDYGQDLIDGLVLRNVLSHDYDGDKFEAAENDFRTKVYPSLKLLHDF
jgi:hypothetical protein